MEYHKINTIYKREMTGSRKGKLIVGDWTQSEFEYLKDLDWEWTEKIDGTNIRVYIDKNLDGYSVKFKGRTDNADIPKLLLNKLSELFFHSDEIKEFIDNLDTSKENQSLILYGEGYGKGIQKGGNYISNDVNFILFDVKISNWWLTREACEDIAKQLCIDIVPILGYGTLEQACEKVKQGFTSTISENKDYIAEGLILKPKVHLKDRAGKRIITKIKNCDFKDL